MILSFSPVTLFLSGKITWPPCASGSGPLLAGVTAAILPRALSHAPWSTSTLADLPLPPTGTFEPWLVNALLVVSIFGAAFWAWNQGKDAIGRKPPVDEELAAFKQHVEEEMVTHQELDRALQTVASDIERKFERALHEEFKQLNGERSRSIAGLHEKVEGTTKELREQISRVSNEMPGKIIRLLKDTGHLE